MQLAKLIKYKNFFFSFAIGLITFIAISIFILYITAPKIPLLGFHGIIDLEKPDQVFVQGTAFQEMAYNKQDLEPVLDYLLQNNYWFLSTQELYDYFLTKSQPLPSEKIGKRPIMLSFDDGYKTDYVNLLPLLESLEKKYNQKVKVVLFINPGTLATKDSIASTKLGCPEIREGLQKGFYDIQSHGLTHKDLAKIDPKTLTIELAEAQTQLKQCTADLDPNQEVGTHIAYPYGSANKQVEAAAAKYYKSGYLYNSKFLNHCWLKNRYQISRLTVNREKSPQSVIEMAQKSHQVKRDRC